jgi:hypothetical protein
MAPVFRGVVPRMEVLYELAVLAAAHQLEAVLGIATRPATVSSPNQASLQPPGVSLFSAGHRPVCAIAI